jgi:hypothetical protein
MNTDNKKVETEQCTIPSVTCCSRCGGKIDGDRWENGWPNYGYIHLGFAAQAFGALAGMEHIASREHFEAWSKRHKAMTKNDAQEVVFEWGAGYKYDSSDRYRLCYKCQKELLKTIGAFFGYGR